MLNLYNDFDLIGLLDSYRPICFYGGGVKVAQQNGVTRYISSAKVENFSQKEFFFSDWFPASSFLQSRRNEKLPVPPSTIAEEKQYNPFMRVKSVEEMKEMRERKNNFKWKRLDVRFSYVLPRLSLTATLPHTFQRSVVSFFLPAFYLHV